MGQLCIAARKMQLLLRLSLLFLAFRSEAAPDAAPMTEKELKAGLEVAVKDSADLADELGDMLKHLEEEEENTNDEEDRTSTIDKLSKDLEKALEVSEILVDAVEDQSKSGLELLNFETKELNVTETEVEDAVDISILLQDLQKRPENSRENKIQKNKNRKGKQLTVSDLLNLLDV